MQALGRTWQLRPDLLARRRLTPDERLLLEEYCVAAGVEPPRQVPGLDQAQIGDR